MLIMKQVSGFSANIATIFVHLALRFVFGEILRRYHAKRTRHCMIQISV